MARGRKTPTIINCIIAGNRKAGLDTEYSIVSNCTIVGNAGSGIVGYGASISNSILWDNSPQQIIDGHQTCSVRYSDIQGGWSGEGNLETDPSFVGPGYWVDANDPNITVEPNDSNAVWVGGDYRLSRGSPCIDAGDNSSIPLDAYDLDDDGNTTEPIPWDLEGKHRMVDGNNDGSAVVDMGAYEYFVPPLEVSMKFTPQALNPGSKGNWVKAHFVLPEGFGVDDVDTNTPAMIEPGDIESCNMSVFVNEEGLVEIEAAFERGKFCAIATGDNGVEVRGIGSFTSGQDFYGTDRIRITSNTLKYLADLASHWLEANCDKPDWCSGVDLDQSSVVDFIDFALFDGCSIEIIAE